MGSESQLTYLSCLMYYPLMALSSPIQSFVFFCVFFILSHESTERSCTPSSGSSLLPNTLPVIWGGETKGSTKTQHLYFTFLL